MSARINFLKFSYASMASLIFFIVNLCTELHMKRGPTYNYRLYRMRHPKYFPIRNELLSNFRTCERTLDYSDIWRKIDSWSRETSNEIYPAYSPYMCQALAALREVPFLAAHNFYKGAFFKLQLEIEGGKMLLFKPAYYARQDIIEGFIYEGQDRHNSEILAFYLSAVLGFRSTPLAVGRRVNIRDLANIATDDLRDTVILEENGYNRTCIYGKCAYCRRHEPVCGNEYQDIEGVFMYMISGPLEEKFSPWKRHYDEGEEKLAAWQKDDRYCDRLKLKMSVVQLLDSVDVAIFDYLIQNGDRHTYETRRGRLVFFDNGKAFGDYRSDVADILAPLYQCCMIRRKTYNRLLIFAGGALTETLDELTKNDLLYPIIIDEHYQAMERRLDHIFVEIEKCVKEFGNQIFY